MMSCKLTIPYSTNITSLLEMGRQEASSYEGQFCGDINGGNFNISALGGIFVGNYVVHEKIIEITISNKPFLIPCIAIESFLKAHIK